MWVRPRRRLRLKPIASEQELYVLWLLETEGAIGRYRLAGMLGTSQGVARGVLARMRTRGFITVRPRAGAKASSKGRRQLHTLMVRHRLKLVQRFDQEILGLGPENVVFQVARGLNQLGHGVEQRDAAIKAGAAGAVTIFFDGRMLRFPGVTESVSRRSPITFSYLKERLKMRKGDVILIAFGPTWWNAARGGFAAVKTLV